MPLPVRLFPSLLPPPLLFRRSYFGTLKTRRIVKDNVYEDFFDAVGNTPLIKLRKASAVTGCNIYGKAEFLNPGGSVKDRAAAFLILDAEERGELRRGEKGLVVEGTAGNTGIGLALAARARVSRGEAGEGKSVLQGYDCIIVMPENQTEEKKTAIRLAGAQLLTVPAVPYRNPNNYVRWVGRMVEDLKKRGEGETGPVVWMQQFDNAANRRAHVLSTGPEIHAQLDGNIDAFSCAMGTGGTIGGLWEFFKGEGGGGGKDGRVKICLTDPEGAMLYRWYTEGALRAEGSSISEGIGQARVTGNLPPGFRPDIALEVGDEEALRWNYQLLEEEGLSLGLSSGINVAGAVKVAKELGPGHTVVTILCDSAQRYESKMFNEEFLRSKGLPVPDVLGASRIPQALEEALQRAKASPEEVEDALKKYAEKVPEELTTGKPLW